MECVLSAEICIRVKRLYSHKHSDLTSPCQFALLLLYFVISVLALSIWCSGNSIFLDLFATFNSKD